VPIIWGVWSEIRTLTIPDDLKKKSFSKDLESKSVPIRTSNGFVPSRAFIASLREAIEWINPVDLEGIDFVFLFNDVPVTPQGQDLELDKVLQERFLLFGAYRARTEHSPAHVILIVHNISKQLPKILRRSSGMTLLIAETLAHEVGHHLIAEKRFILRRNQNEEVENEEDFADRYATSLVRRMKGARRFRVGAAWLNLAAAIDYAKGAHYWKKQKYNRAADHFYMTCVLRPDDKDAGFWYRQAKAREREQNR
jgi:hypothetical protein